MKTNTTVYIPPTAVRYRFGGVNLFELRRVQLRRIARSLDVPDTRAVNDTNNVSLSHNELLGAIIAKLDALSAPKELMELQSQQPPEKKKPEKKTSRKKSKK